MHIFYNLHMLTSAGVLWSFQSDGANFVERRAGFQLMRQS